MCFKMCLLLFALMGSDEQEPTLISRRFASAPDISSPTGIAVSMDGVVFVSCDPNGTTNRYRDAGYVVRCEDTDGNGVADRFTRYVDHINSPRGSCCLTETLYLLQSPDLVACRDPNGDGVAEERTVIISRVGPDLTSGGIVHGPNGICPAIDGWLYLAIGDQGSYQAEGTDGSQVTLHGGGVLRVRPDGSHLEIVCTGTRNIYDIAVDSRLNVYARDNSNDGGGWGTRLLQIHELADYGYPHLYRHFPREAMPCLIDEGPGAATAICCLEEPDFPAAFSNALLSCDFNAGILRYDRSTQSPTPNLAWPLPRIVGLETDACSRLFCVSRQGGGFGPSRQPFGHIDVLRSAATEVTSPPPAVLSADDESLVRLLGHRSHVVRINALHELTQRQRSDAVITQLTAAAADQQRSLAERNAAVFALKRIDGQRSHDTLRQLWEDAAIRPVVVRAAADVTSQLDDISRDVCLRALTDPAAAVRRQGLVGLARLGDRTTAAAIFPLATSRLAGSDEPRESESPRTPDVAAVQAHCARAALVRLQPIPFLLRQLEQRQTAESALCVLQHIHTAEVVAGLSDRLRRTNDQQQIKHIALALIRLFHREGPWDGHSWWRTRPHIPGPYRRPVRWEQTAAVITALEIAFHKAAENDLDELFRALRRHGISQSELTLHVNYDRALALLGRPELTPAERLLLLEAACDPQRHIEQQLRIFQHFAAGPLPQSYYDRIQIFRRWGEAAAAHPQQRRAWRRFITGVEFQQNFAALPQFLGDTERDANAYAHRQLLSLLNDTNTPESTRNAAAEQLQKTWDEQRKIYPHRLRGLMLALEHTDPAPFAKQLRPLIDHRDERVKQPAARLLQQQP